MTLREKIINDVPQDLALWLSEKQLLCLVFQSMAEVHWPQAPRRDPLLCSTPVPVLRSLLLYAYARGIYSSQDLERLCRSDATFRYICAGALPLADEMRAFRRKNISFLQTALCVLIKSTFLLNLHLLPHSSGNLAELAREQSALRLGEAVQTDSIWLDL